MQIIRAEKLKEKPADQSKLGFGKIFTDYMLTMRYKNGAWDEPRIEPYGPRLRPRHHGIPLRAGHF